MKHHFGDMLDRSGDHWAIVPNAERHAYHLPEWSDAQKRVSIATISATDANWEIIATFPNLEELTLHAPSMAQLEFVSQLWRLKRLRITHARPKRIDFLERLQNLEEVVLEYVSGFDDISPLGSLKKLKALHLENLRRVSDFSALGAATDLRYLGLYGTVDWSQPVQGFDFLSSLTKLEWLGLGFIKPPRVEQPLAALGRLTHLRKLKIAMDAFPLEIHAQVEAMLPDVEGAKRPAFFRFGGKDEPIHPRDIRFSMPIEEFSRHPSLHVGADGKRYQRVPHQAVLLGRGQRSVSGAEAIVDKACDQHTAKYRDLVASYVEAKT